MMEVKTDFGAATLKLFTSDKGQVEWLDARDGNVAYKAAITLEYIQGSFQWVITNESFEKTGEGEDSHLRAELSIAALSLFDQKMTAKHRQQFLTQYENWTQEQADRLNRAAIVGELRQLDQFIEENAKKAAKLQEERSQLIERFLRTLA